MTIHGVDGSDAETVRDAHALAEVEDAIRSAVQETWTTDGPAAVPRQTMTERVYDAVRAVLARPAAGRDLTAQDVRDALSNSSISYGTSELVAEILNRIARPAVARTDGQPPAKPNPLRTREDWRRAAREDAEAALQETLARSTYRTEGLPPADEQVPGESGPVDLPGQTPMTFEQARAYIDAHFDASRADAAISALYRVPSAAPADDTAAPDPDLATEYRAVMAGYGTGARGDLNMLRRVYRPQIEAGEVWIESRTVSPWTRMPDAGQPVRDSQDGGA